MPFDSKPLLVTFYKEIFEILDAVKVALRNLCMGNLNSIAKHIVLPLAST